MADQFLDTENRHDLPRLAEDCVRAGLSPDEVAQIWKFEVTPAVWRNLHSLLGEWAAWDADEILRRIERRRGDFLSRPGRFQEWVYRSRVGGLHRHLECVLKLMRCLAKMSETDRSDWTRKMTILARVYFDMRAALEPNCENLMDLYLSTFRDIFEQLVVDDAQWHHESRRICDQRVREYLRSPGPIGSS